MSNTSTPRGDATVLRQYLSAIISSSAHWHVDPILVGAIIMHESGGVPGLVSSSGARGLMQVEPSTNPRANDARMSGTSASDAAYQIDVGAETLARAFAAAPSGNTTAALQNYSGPNYPTFADEIRNMYAPAVVAAIGSNLGSNIGVSGGTIGGASTNPFANVPIIGGITNAASAATSAASTFGGLVSFFSQPESWIRILLGLVAVSLILGGLFLTFIHSDVGEKTTQAATVAAAAA